MAQTAMEDKKYFGWLWALKLCGVKWFGWSENTAPCPKSWRHFYDDKLNAIEALKADLNN